MKWRALKLQENHTFPIVDKREKSREEWERQFREDQYNIIPADGSQVGHIMAKRSSTPAPIPDFAHLIRSFLSVALLAIGTAILWSNNPHKVWLGLSALTAGFYLGITAFRRPRKD